MRKTKSELLKKLVCPNCDVICNTLNLVKYQSCSSCRGRVQENDAIGLRFTCPACNKLNFVSPVMQITHDRDNDALDNWDDPHFVRKTWKELRYFPVCSHCEVKLPTNPSGPSGEFTFKSYNVGGKVEYQS